MRTGKRGSGGADVASSAGVRAASLPRKAATCWTLADATAAAAATSLAAAAPTRLPPTISLRPGPPAAAAAETAAGCGACPPPLTRSAHGAVAFVENSLKGVAG